MLSSYLQHSRCYLDLDSAKLLATARVSSRLDNCNSLLYGIAVTDLTKLQHVQNQLARGVAKSHLFTCSVSLFHSPHWLPVNFRVLFKITLLTCKTIRENCSLIFTPCLLHHSDPVHSHQRKELVCRCIGSRPTQVQEHFTLVPLLFGTTCRCLSVQPFQLLPSRNIWKHISLIWPPPPPIDTSTPDGLLMLWSCSIDLALEHWFGCHATDPGFAGDISTTEIWLIDWLKTRLWMTFAILPVLELTCHTSSKYQNKFCSWWQRDESTSSGS